MQWDDTDLGHFYTFFTFLASRYFSEVVFHMIYNVYCYYRRHSLLSPSGFDGKLMGQVRKERAFNAAVLVPAGYHLPGVDPFQKR